MFEIFYSHQAYKFLKKADSTLRERLHKRITSLVANPFPQEVKHIEGSKEKLYRIRVGDYRILYELDHKTNTLGIVKIDKRKSVYD